MSPILGIWASAQQPALNATSFESIATVTVGSSGSSTITFSSIPSTYKHLQLRMIAKTDRALNRDGINVNFNSDTTSSYSQHYLLGDATGATPAAAAGGNSSDTSTAIYRATGNSSATDIFGAIIYDILDYADTNKYKTGRYLGGFDANGAGEIYEGSTLWQKTNAISTIALIPRIGTKFLQYSSFALYGVKG